MIGSIVMSALAKEHFFVAHGYRLRIDAPAEETVGWELFGGHLLDEKQTRCHKTFRSWNVFLEDPTDPSPVFPFISIKWDQNQHQIHVVRSILIHGWEAFESATSVISSRAVQKPLRELVGTIQLSHDTDSSQLASQLSWCLTLAVEGTSRLPITSLESPLPAYSLGQLAYFPAEAAPCSVAPLCDPFRLVAERLNAAASPRAQARLLETALRAVEPEDTRRLADVWVEGWRKAGRQPAGLPTVVVNLFNHVALSPYTGFVDHLICLLDEWIAPDRVGLAEIFDLIGYMLRHLVRHLTAYDLTTFHNQGANYPDALLLHALLERFLGYLEHHTELVAGNGATNSLPRMRRRALRQAWLMRKTLEGLRVPDLPTSPGENLRILPEPFRPVPNEQLVDPSARHLQLFVDRTAEELLVPSTRHALEESARDLADPKEIRELGMAVFLDRPLGMCKQPGELDRTSLLTYEAFSRAIARQRLAWLGQVELIGTALVPTRNQELEHLPVHGYPARQLTGGGRGPVAALEDARQASDDFIFLRTTRVSLNQLYADYDLGPLRTTALDVADWLERGSHVLLIRTKAREPGTLTAFDREMRPRVQLRPRHNGDGTVNYVLGAGQEYLEAGLAVTRVWNTDGASTSEFVADVTLGPRI